MVAVFLRENLFSNEKLLNNIERKNMTKPKRDHCTLYAFIACISCALVLIYVFSEIKNVRSTSCSVPESIRLVCYYNFPGGSYDLQPVNLNVTPCTHLITGFLSVKNNELEIDGAQMRTIRELIRLKEHNVNLKVMVSVGGAGNTQGFSEMVANHTNRREFIKSVRIFLKENHVDGIDLDWEYPNALGMNSKERIHFTQLLEEFRMHINKNSYKFLLSIAAPTVPLQVNNSYLVNYVNQYVDFINLMSYDFHYFTKLTPFTGLNSPLFQSKLDQGLFSTLNVNESARYWVNLGMDRSKINVGLPTYGHTFTLFNKYNNGLYSPAKSVGHVGANGFAGYNDICLFLKQKNIGIVFDTATKSPYVFKDFEWISYDNRQSLKLKSQFIVQNGYGGIMVYSLNSDDFKGNCGEKFPLINAISEASVRDVVC